MRICDLGLSSDTVLLLTVLFPSFLPSRDSGFGPGLWDLVTCFGKGSLWLTHSVR